MLMTMLIAQQGRCCRNRINLTNTNSCKILSLYFFYVKKEDYFTIEFFTDLVYNFNIILEYINLGKIVNTAF